MYNTILLSDLWNEHQTIVMVAGVSDNDCDCDNCHDICDKNDYDCNSGHSDNRFEIF